mmetsp:Transcript_123293/g.307906  ORF Transcript_123293/g.307906 Transcript_123293/m.307906 type:complete len:235 (-) Transcript_123293:1260-1964(-)
MQGRRQDRNKHESKQLHLDSHVLLQGETPPERVVCRPWKHSLQEMLEVWQEDHVAHRQENGSKDTRGRKELSPPWAGWVELLHGHDADVEQEESKGVERLRRHDHDEENKAHVAEDATHPQKPSERGRRDEEGGRLQDSSAQHACLDGGQSRNDEVGHGGLRQGEARARQADELLVPDSKDLPAEKRDDDRIAVEQQATPHHSMPPQDVPTHEMRRSTASAGQQRQDPQDVTQA